VNGWVEDTRADSRCAYVHGYSHLGQEQRSANACPQGNRKWFTFNFPGNACCTFTIELWTVAVARAEASPLRR
jgi:hypothetical protein